MHLHVVLEILAVPDRASLDRPETIEQLLDAAVRAGGFTELARKTVRFQPQGVTAFAVVGESHVALHTWPEEGRLFVDVASCGSRESAVAAVVAVREACRGEVVTRDERTLEG
jgi:S-adenosylmethionine decarboxylase